jgi:hypothetical protein
MLLDYGIAIFMSMPKAEKKFFVRSVRMFMLLLRVIFRMQKMYLAIPKLSAGKSR